MALWYLQWTKWLIRLTKFVTDLLNIGLTILRSQPYFTTHFFYCICKNHWSDLPPRKFHNKKENNCIYYFFRKQVYLIKDLANYLNLINTSVKFEYSFIFVINIITINVVLFRFLTFFSQPYYELYKKLELLSG